jgi:hypothetical protein
LPYHSFFLNKSKGEGKVLLSFIQMDVGKQGVPFNDESIIFKDSAVKLVRSFFAREGGWFRQWRCEASSEFDK